MAYNEGKGELYCCEDISRIENFDKASTSEEMYEFHHRKETELGVSKEWLIKNNMYYKRPSNELILLPQAEHRRMHAQIISDKLSERMSKRMKGVPKTEEHKAKISASKKGKTRPRWIIENLRSVNLGSKHSEEHKAKIGAASKAVAIRKDSYVCPLILFTLSSVKDLSIKEIAQELGVSQNVIRRKLKKYKIPKHETN